VRADNFSIPLLSSIALHGCAILLASFLAQTKTPRPQNYFSVHLLEARISENQASRPGVQAEAKPPPRPVQKTAPRRTIKAPSKAPVITPAPALPAPKQDEQIKAPETKTATPAPMKSSPSATLNPNGEGGGSPVGALASSGNGEIGVVTGNGTGARGGGMATFGLGRGAGVPGAPAHPVLRTNREAQPIQTARANYPPMALRRGLESDVTLKIEVDSQGNVTKAEIAKSGGGGFDEEALKAVKQSRFEPAQRDGGNIAAEFTYVYRFRIRR
jgi:protein TonB